jgi:integrase
MELKYSKGNVSVTLVYDTRRANKDDKYPIRFRIIYDRDTYYISPGYYFTEDEFTKLSKTRDKTLINDMDLIDISFNKLKTAINEILKDGEYSHDKLRVQLKKGKSKDLIDYIEYLIVDFESKGQIGNAGVYATTKKFLKTYLGDKVPFNQITPKVLEALTDPSNSGLKQTTLAIYMRTIRSVYNKAIDDKMISSSIYPFSNGRDKKFKIREGEGTHNALTIHQLSQIAAYKIDKYSPALNRSRDLFLLMFHLGGINIGDLLSLKWKDIKNREIIYKRRKTIRTTRKEVLIKVPITDTVQKYLDIYASADQLPDNFIIPYLQGITGSKITTLKIKSFTKNMNDDLKKISEDLKLPRVSTMVARHTFATITKNSGASESFIKETLGHASLATTQNYLKGFEADQRRKLFENLENITNNG